MPQLPTELGAAIGLGVNFDVAPLSYTWQRATLQTTQGTKTLHVLRVETPSGVFGFTFIDDDMATFVAKAIEAKSGVIIPTTQEIGNNGKH